MSKKQELQEAVKEAAEFIRRAELLLDSGNEYYMDNSAACRGDLNRQSMELTRSLAKFRKASAYSL